MNDYRVTLRLKNRAPVVIRVRAQSGRGAQRIAIDYAARAFGDRWSREYPIVERQRAAA